MKLFGGAPATLQTLQKKIKSFSDNRDLGALIKNDSAEIITEPFPHVVIDDFFTQEVYEKLLEHFNSVLSRGTSEVDGPNRFRPFLNLKGEFAYDGYIYTPRFGEPGAANFFYSLPWNLFFSSLFDQPTSWCTSMAYHFHPKGDKTGFVHHDYASKVFVEEDRISNGVVYRARESAGRTKSYSKERRIISLLYYLGNDDWKEGDGGETGLYASKEGSPVKLVAPKNNRMLAFQISPKSFHAFQQNNTPRSSIVQWFHVDEPWAKKKFGFL